MKVLFKLILPIFMLLFSSCDYTTGVRVLTTNIDGTPIPGLKCSLIKIESDEVLGSSFSPDSGYVQFPVTSKVNVFEIVETDEEVVARYKILIEDIDGEENLGEFATVEYFPNNGVKESDYQVKMELK